MIKKRGPRMPWKSNPTTRALLGVLFLAASVLIAFFLLPYFYKGMSGTETVYVAAHDIKKGDIVESGALKTKDVGVYGIEGYFTDKRLIAGKVALYDIASGDIIFESKIAAREGNEILFLPEDDRGLITITVKTNAAGLASHLRNGSIVNVYNVTKVTNYNGDTMTAENEFVPALNPLLANMEVYSIENSASSPIENDSGEADGIARASNSSANIVSTITFFTTSIEQEMELLKAEYDGAIHISLIEF